MATCYSLRDLKFLKDKDVWDYSGNVTVNAQRVDELNKAFRRWAIRNHPDKGGDAEVFKEVLKSYQNVKSCVYTQGTSFGGWAAPKPSAPPPRRKTPIEYQEDVLYLFRKHGKQADMVFNTNTGIYLNIGKEAYKKYILIGYVADLEHGILIPPKNLRTPGVPDNLYDLYGTFDSLSKKPSPPPTPKKPSPSPPAPKKPSPPPAPKKEEEKAPPPKPEKGKEKEKEAPKPKPKSTKRKSRKKKAKSDEEKYTGNENKRVFNAKTGNYILVDGKAYKRYLKEGYIVDQMKHTMYPPNEGSAGPSVPNPKNKEEGDDKKPKKIIWLINKNTNKKVLYGGKPYEKLIKQGYILNLKERTLGENTHPSS